MKFFAILLFISSTGFAGTDSLQFISDSSLEISEKLERIYSKGKVVYASSPEDALPYFEKALNIAIEYDEEFWQAKNTCLYRICLL